MTFVYDAFSFFFISGFQSYSSFCDVKGVGGSGHLPYLPAIRMMNEFILGLVTGY